MVDICIRRFLWLSLVLVHLTLSRYILRHSSEQMIVDDLSASPPAVVLVNTILLHWPLRSKDVFEMFLLHQTKACHATAQSRSFYQNTEIKQSRNPSSIAFFCCRREYEIAIDLAAFDETGPCWQRYRSLWKEAWRHETLITNLIEENIARNKE